jgi:integrase
MSAFLQFLKETGCDSGEAWKLRWIDIDTERKTVAITPTKNHDARTLPISANLLSRLLKLPRVNDRVFASKNLDKMRWLFERTRNKLADNLEDPRLRQISL